MKCVAMQTHDGMPSKRCKNKTRKCPDKCRRCAGNDLCFDHRNYRNEGNEITRYVRG